MTLRVGAGRGLGVCMISGIMRPKGNIGSSAAAAKAAIALHGLVSIAIYYGV